MAGSRRWDSSVGRPPYPDRSITTERGRTVGPGGPVRLGPLLFKVIRWSFGRARSHPSLTDRYSGRRGDPVLRRGPVDYPAVSEVGSQELGQPCQVVLFIAEEPAVMAVADAFMVWSAADDETVDVSTGHAEAAGWTAPRLDDLLGGGPKHHRGRPIQEHPVRQPSRRVPRIWGSRCVCRVRRLIGRQIHDQRVRSVSQNAGVLKGLLRMATCGNGSRSGALARTRADGHL